MREFSIRYLIYLSLSLLCLNPITSSADNQLRQPKSQNSDPLRLTVTAGNQQVNLTWKTIKGAADYWLCQANEAIVNINLCQSYAGGTWRTIKANKASNVSGLTNGKLYYFQLMAENSTQQVISTLQSATPVVPTSYGTNDSGSTICTDDRQILPCPVLGFPGQDAETGRDVRMNDNRNGFAGFDFTKLSNTVVKVDATELNWRCVLDNVTGLMWEVKTFDGGLHDQNWTYTWYEPDNKLNGGGVGYSNGGLCQKSQCDTFSFRQATNLEGLCGFNDWRLPTKAELFSIINYGAMLPAIDLIYFPNTVNNGYWTSTPSAASIENAFVINFTGGNDRSDFKHSPFSVRLVRKSQ